MLLDRICHYLPPKQVVRRSLMMVSSVAFGVMLSMGVVVWRYMEVNPQHGYLPAVVWVGWLAYFTFQFLLFRMI